MASEIDIESVLNEQRVFTCDPAFAEAAHVKSTDEYERIYRESIADPEAFWAKVGSELAWFTPPEKTLEWNCPDAKWFVGGQLNLSYNCLDRHLTTARRNKAAIIWEGEPGDVRVLTYQMLHSRGVPLRQRAEAARHQDRRPGRHLHADDPRGGDRDAGLRPHRRDALGGLRRLQRRGAPRPHQRRRGARS